MLVAHFVQKHAQRLGSLVTGVSDASLARLRNRWPGNIPELESLLEERAVVTAREPLLEIDRALLKRVCRLATIACSREYRHRAAWEKCGWRSHRCWRGLQPSSSFPRRTRWTWGSSINILVGFAGAKPRPPRGLQLSLHGQAVQLRRQRDRRPFYYVMELLRGLDLGVNHHPASGRMPAERVAMLLRPACRSLSEAS